MAIALQIVSGLLGGYIAVSVCESFFHRTIQHAGPVLRAWYGRAGGPGRALLRAWFSHHVVHHCLTFRRNHISQFTDAAEQERLDARLQARRESDIIACRYGTALGRNPGNYLRYLSPTLPIFIVLCWLGGGWFTLGAVAPLCAMPVLAHVIHPYLHMRYEDVTKRGPFVIRMVARTGYFRYLARHHWLHHRYTGCNYNLLLGGDYLLRAQRPATPEDLDAMRAIGLWVPHAGKP